MRDTLLIIHILAAAVWIGGAAAATFLSARFSAADEEAQAEFWGGFEKMGKVYYPPAAVVLLITGILLVTDTSVYEFEDAFVMIGIATIVVGALLGSRVFGPLAKRIKQAHEQGDANTARATYGRFRGFAALDLSILTFAVVAMVLRLGS